MYIDTKVDHVRINVCKGQHQNISTLESSASSRSSKGRNNITLSDSGIYIYINVCMKKIIYIHSAWCFDNNNLFVFPHVTCNVLSVLNKQ